MALYTLPSELLDEIAWNLDSEKDIDNLVRCCRRFHGTLNQFLYRHNVQHADGCALTWAAENGREATLECAIAAEIDIAKSELGLLQIAASKGHEHIIRLLLNTDGIDINAWDMHGCTPLLSAVQSGLLDMVQLFLHHGANISQPSTDQVYPLNKAIEAVNIEMATLLINSTTDLATASNRGWMPLHYAADKGCADLVALLIERGANTTRLTKTDWSPLALAVDNSHLEATTILLQKGGDVITHHGDNWPVLHLASDVGEINIIKLLLLHGADVSMLDRHAYLPLQRACLEGHIKAVDILVEHGADVNTPRTQGSTPLIDAISQGHVELAKHLLELGAKFDAQDAFGTTPLLEAIYGGHGGLAMLLLESGADATLSGRGNGSVPAIFSAASQGLSELIGPLIDGGCDIEATTGSGWTALAEAIENGHSKTVEVLLEKGANMFPSPTGIWDGWQPLTTAARQGYLEIVKILLERGVAIDSTTPDKRTPLIWASIMGHLEVVQYLLDHDADAERQDSSDFTALHHAVEENGLDIVLELLARDSNEEVRLNPRWSPPIAAAQLGHVDMVKALLDTGRFQINHADEDGRTPLFQAAMRGHTDVVRLLISHDPFPLANTKDRYGATPLIAAARNGHAEAVELLLTLDDANIQETDDFGYNAMFWAERCVDEVTVEILRTFATEVGVDISQSDQDAQIKCVEFDGDACWCDICGRCSIAGTTSMQCVPCGGCQFLICPECEAAGAKCRDSGHTWEDYLCPCQLDRN